MPIKKRGTGQSFRREARIGIQLSDRDIQRFNLIRPIIVQSFRDRLNDPSVSIVERQFLRYSIYHNGADNFYDLQTLEHIFNPENYHNERDILQPDEYTTEAETNSSVGRGVLKYKTHWYSS